MSAEQPLPEAEPPTDVQAPVSAPLPPPPPPTPIQPYPRIFKVARVAGPLTTALLSMLLVALLVNQLQQTNHLLENQVAAQQAALSSAQGQIESLQAEVQDLKERWYGNPAIYQPPAISNTNIVFFDVKGTTQQQLIDSLNNSDICTKYGPCLVDPAVPSGVAWGLEGFSWPGYYCYSPATTTPAFREQVILPKWSPPADGSVKIPLVVKWNALAKSIFVHEAGHVTIDQQDLADLNSQAQHLPSCDALIAFWNDPHTFDKLNADQNAYHARLRADCRPEIGCIPYGWMGW